MEEEHHHHYHHYHYEYSVADLQQLNRAFYIGVGSNLLCTIIEFVVGFSINPLVLISGVNHNLSGVASLVTSLIGMKLTHKAATQLHAYGYKEASIFVSFINAVPLIYIVVKIFIEVFERLSSPPEMAGSVIVTAASIGTVIDAVSTFLFYKGQRTDINIKGVSLHLMLDALVSVGVVISGAIIYFAGWNIADPISSFIVAIVILFSTWGLLKESIKLILDDVPADVDGPHTREQLEVHPLVAGVHRIYIWALNSSQNAFTAHIVLKEHLPLREVMELKKELKHTLLHQHISHATLEIDALDCCCENEKCQIVTLWIRINKFLRITSGG